ncbi:MAG: 6-phospho-beta-glucosidase [Deltaproteobacteria bacterium]|nr:6-phospho-beta-glucosidase [Deltaproteobacteria bacterium]
MKIAVVGGGSTYTPELAEGLRARAGELQIESLELFDLDTKRLAIVGGFVTRMTAGSGIAVRTHAELDRCLEGADFVVVQIRAGGQAARLRDERLGRDHGIIGQETTGIGGLANALRTIPQVLHIAHRAEAIAPEATLIDFTNPVSIVTEALIRHARIRSIGLCNIPISQRREIAAHLGVSERDVEIDSVGLNHLSFIRGVRVGGREVIDSLIAELAGALAKGLRPRNIPDLDFPPELLEALRMIPSDYLRYFFLSTETIAEQRQKARLRAEEVAEIEAELLGEYARPDNRTKPEGLSKRGGAHYSHAALEIIEAMATNSGRALTVDVRNGTTLRELPEDCSIEVPAYVSSTGATPLAQRPLEPQIRGLIQHVKAYEELAVAAALSRGRRDVYLAVLAHPLVPSASLASRLTDALMRELRPEG